MISSPVQSLGRHVHLDLYGLDPGRIAAPSHIAPHLRAAAQMMGATIVSEHCHAFSPFGVSGVVIIAESHLTIHTWPEHGYAAVDIFTCGVLDLDAGLRYLIEALSPTRHVLNFYDRGPANLSPAGAL